MDPSKLDPGADRPLSLQLADLLREDIVTGVLLPGAKLPSEQEFAELTGLSRTPIRGALATLASEGLVTTRKGYGAFVREQRPLRRRMSSRGRFDFQSSGKPVFDTLAIDQGQVPSRRMLHVGRVPVPRDIAEWLKTHASDEAVERQRLQLLDGEPAVLSNSYYPLWLAAGTDLEDPGPLPEGPDLYIESLGYRFMHTVEVLRARMPSPEERKTLRLAAGVPVVRLIHVDYDADGRPLQVADDLYAADRHEFGYEWGTPEGDVHG